MKKNTLENTMEKMLKAGVFKIELEKITNTALEISGLKVDYTDDQLSDAMIVFVEVFTNKMFDFHKDKLSEEQMAELAMESGKSLRQTVLLFTGVDLHNSYGRNKKGGSEDRGEESPTKDGPSTQKSK